MKIKSLTCVILAVLVGVAFAGETVANPEFESWVSFDVGASVTMKTVTEMAGTASESAMTTEMTAKEDESLELTTTVKMTVQGQEMEFPSDPRTVNAEVPVVEPEDAPETEADVETEEGEETITVPAGEFECKMMKTTTTTDEMTTVSTVWTCDDVPGGMVKMVSHIEMAQGMVTDTTMELTEMTTGE